MPSSHVLLHASGLDFAVDAADTLELMRSERPLVTMPRSDVRVLGVVMHRGSALPVTSIGRWHAPACEPVEAVDDRPLICVVQHEGRRLGLLVRQLGRVVRPPASAVQTLCHDDASTEVFSRTVTVDGRLWPILDAAALLQVSRSWSVPTVATDAAGPDAHRQAAAWLAVFKTGSTWFAVPADRTLQVLGTGDVQPVGGGSGQLVGAVSWRSRIVPLVRPQPSAVGPAASPLMVVVRATRPQDGGWAETVIAIAADAVDRPQRVRLEGHGGGADHALDGIGGAPSAPLGDGRFVTPVDPDELAKHFAFDWSSPHAPTSGAVSNEGLPTPMRNAEPYLVYRAGERVAIALSCVDAVLLPEQGAVTEARPPAGASCAEPAGLGTLVWRGQPLPFHAWSECPPDGEGLGVRPVLIVRTGPRRHARQVSAVDFIVPVGAAQLCRVNWPGRGPEQLLTTAVDGVRVTVRLVH